MPGEPTCAARPRRSTTRASCRWPRASASAPRRRPTTEVVERCAARLLLFDHADRLLLFCGRDPHRPQIGAFWFTAGGGLREGESFEDAARRELREETGLTAAELRGPVHERETVFEHESVTYHQRERFYVTRTDASAIDTGAFDDLERRTIVGHRWWTLGELETTREVVYPKGLAVLVGAALRPGRSIT